MISYCLMETHFLSNTTTLLPAPKRWLINLNLDYKRAKSERTTLNVYLSLITMKLVGDLPLRDGSKLRSRWNILRPFASYLKGVSSSCVVSRKLRPFDLLILSQDAFFPRSKHSLHICTACTDKDFCGPSTERDKCRDFYSERIWASVWNPMWCSNWNSEA